MKTGLKNAGMIAGMVLSWAIYYAISKVMVSATGSAAMAGFLLRSFALIFLTLQLLLDGNFRSLFSKERSVKILVMIGVFGFLLDLLANMGYATGSLGTGTALLKTDVLMVELATVIIYKKRLFLSDWIGSLVMLFGVLLVLGVSLHGLEFQLSNLFFIGSALCVTANAFIIKAAQEKHGETPDTISYYNNFVVLMLFACSTALGGGFDFSAAGSLKGFWLLAALGGLAQTGIYFFYYRNLSHHEVWVVKLYLLLMPIVSLLIGVVFLEEPLTMTKVIGIVTVLLGAAIILLRNKINGGKI